VRSLAWISKTVDDGFGNPLIQNSLYMLQTAALTFVTTADTGVKSRTAFGTPMQITNPAAIVSDGSDTIYVAEGSEIDTYTVSTKASVQYSVGSIGPPLTFFGKITGLALSGATVYVGDDATGASAAGQGRIWTD
jgi:hypothetical protein